MRLPHETTADSVPGLDITDLDHANERARITAKGHVVR
ncbi:hypothetical protein HNR40_007396 [Nonomuraea endophytica]|uniref:Uncharacterized protein n=1 Tax=Nonomuraea endophytica TaxID=714136 RepID=A0A7W8A931_9ACTN|nr:hypothetical protein [Nonomuraea endophytica]